MDEKQVRERVEEIRRIAPDDDETAHSLEDELRYDVLDYIAAHPHGRNNALLAQLACETSDIAFSRWCA